MFVSARVGVAAAVAAGLLNVRPVLAVSGAERAEVARVRQHIWGAEQLMARRDVSGLSRAQRTARARNLKLLRSYRAAGVFPHNTHFPDRRVPVFRDDNGNLCAMAYLLDKSGRTDLVNRVAQTRNYARIPELAHDPALVAWLRDAGMTAQEAARVQPTYGYDNSAKHDRDLRRNATVAAVGSGVAITANLMPLRSDTQKVAAGVFGLAASVYSFKVAGDGLGDGGINLDNVGIGLGSGVLGGVDLYLGVRSLLRLNKKQSKTSGASANGAGTAFVHDTDLRIHPVVLPRGGGLVFSRHF